MKIKKIIFIEPKTERLHIYSRYNLPRIGSILLATILKQAGYKTKVYFMKQREIINKNIQADLVAISTITPTVPQAYKLADYFKQRGIPVVIGGPHVTFLPEEAIEHADYCIRGEGDIALPELIKTLNSGGSLKNVPGLSWKQGGKMHSNPLAPSVTDLDSLPFPDMSLLENSRSNKLRLPFGRQTIPIQTSRGCPFDCNFCSVTEMFGRKYRYRSAENIISELKQYDPKKHFLFFYDDNFTVNRKRTKRLLKMMIELNLGFDWSTQVRSDVANDLELLDMMQKAGCKALYIGFESVDPQALAEMNKAQSVDQIKRAIREITYRKIHLHGMFVFGFDADTPQTIKATIDFAIKYKIDTTQFLILTPLPGTQFYYKMIKENRILDTKWDTYDAHHVKFKPRNFSPFELQFAQIKAHARFYSPVNIIKRLFHLRLRALFIGLYANNLNKKWQKFERKYIHYLKNLVFAK